MAIDVLRVSEPGALAKELPKIFVGSLHHVLASCKALASGSCIRNAPGIRVLTGRCTFDIDIGLEDLHCDRSWLIGAQIALCGPNLFLGRICFVTVNDVEHWKGLLGGGEGHFNSWYFLW